MPVVKRFRETKGKFYYLAVGVHHLRAAPYLMREKNNKQTTQCFCFTAGYTGAVDADWMEVKFSLGFVIISNSDF